MFLIVDVSNNNGRVDFRAIKAAGAVGVWLKCTEGISFIDSTYHANRRAAKAAGLKVGAYHFGHPRDGSPREAAFFLRHLVLEKGDLLPMLDLEEREVAAAQVHAYAAGFLAAVSHKIGARCGLYCGSYFMRANGLDTLPGPKWIPSYGAPPAFYRWDAWQFSDGQAKYPGAIAHLDTSKVPVLSAVTYKPPAVHKIAGKAKTKAHRARYMTLHGFRLVRGSDASRWVTRTFGREV